MSEKCKYLLDEEDFQLLDEELGKIWKQKRLSGSNLWGKWWELVSNRTDYSTGEKEFDIDAFKSLLVETSVYRKEFRARINAAKYNAKNSHGVSLITNNLYLTVFDIEGYLNIQSAISEYSGNMHDWQFGQQDKSDNYIFTVSRLLANEMAKEFSSDTNPFDQDGTIVIWKDDLYALDLKDGEDTNAYYNIYKGDMSEVLDVAKRMNEEHFGVFEIGPEEEN